MRNSASKIGLNNSEFVSVGAGEPQLSHLESMLSVHS